MIPTLEQLKEVERIQTIYDDLDREETLREEFERENYHPKIKYSNYNFITEEEY